MEFLCLNCHKYYFADEHKEKINLRDSFLAGNFCSIECAQAWMDKQKGQDNGEFNQFNGILQEKTANTK